MMNGCVRGLFQENELTNVNGTGKERGTEIDIEDEPEIWNATGREGLSVIESEKQTGTGIEIEHREMEAIIRGEGGQAVGYLVLRFKAETGRWRNAWDFESHSKFLAFPFSFGLDRYLRGFICTHPWLQIGRAHV